MKKPIRILFRTAGGRDPKNEVGLGHIIRCTNLASQFKNAKIWFLIEDYGGIKQFLLKKGYKKVISLKKDDSLISDINKTKKCILKNQIDIVIVDKYKLKNYYIREIKNYSKVVVISDLKNINYSSNLVVNGFIGFNNKVTKNKFGVKCLLGPYYQILNENFFKNKQSRKKHYDLVASFGGSDTKNLTLLLLKTLVPKYVTQIRTKIIVGPSNINKNKILQYKKHNNISFVQEPKNIQKEFSDAKIGICTGGLTSYEFAVMKIPFAIISDTKHQLLTAKQWESKGFAQNLDKVDKKTFRKFEKFLDDIIMNKIERPKRNRLFIDGKGVSRVTKEIHKLMT